MNNAKNEGSDASRLALAIRQSLPCIWDMPRSRLPRRYPVSPPQNSPEAECFPARYRRRDCPCLFSPFLFSSTAEARPQPPYLPRFTSARSCSGRCPQQPRESASRKNARSTHRRRKHRADDRGKPYHSCGEDALWQERDRVNRRSGGISDETDENGESDRRSMTEVRRSPPTENPPPRIPGSGTAKAADF